MIADLMPGSTNRGQGVPILIARRVLANDKHSHFLIAFFEELNEPRYDNVQVSGILFPTGVAVGLHVRPFVVEIQRQTGDGFGHDSLPCLNDC